MKRILSCPKLYLYPYLPCVPDSALKNLTSNSLVEVQRAEAQQERGAEGQQQSRGC